MPRARGAGPHRAQDVTPSDPRPRRLGPAQLLELPGPLPPLWAMRLPPAHHPSFQRKDTAYTFRFEHFVLRSLIGSTAEDLARRLGISAEMVEPIVENQRAEDRVIDPERVITDIGLGELGLKKRHRLYVTVRTDLSDPTRPKIL